LAEVLSIDELRQRIDVIDDQLVRLLNVRVACAVEIGKLKHELGMPVYQPDREKKVIEHVRGIAVEGPLGSDAIARLFERIIDEARTLERRVVHGEPVK